MITDQIGFHSVLLTLSIINYSHGACNTYRRYVTLKKINNNNNNNNNNNINYNEKKKEVS